MLPLGHSVARRAAAFTAAAASSSGGARRHLNLHEYQSMALMKLYGVPVPSGAVATTTVEAEVAAEKIKALSTGNSADVVLKAQVLAGGRGLGTFTNGFHSGVHMITRRGQAADIAGKMLGQRLVTKQTGPEGKPTGKVYLMERLYMRRELYLSIMLDRASNGSVIIASTKGGTSIEDVAAATPELITKEVVTLSTGPTEVQLDRLAEFLQFQGKADGQFKDCLKSLWKMFTSTDATLIEVNPLAETPDGDVFVCDAKINFDDNASFRHADIFAMRDHSQEDQREVEAAKWDLNYIGLDGNIGCMVNGAGLAMATMDIIKLHGGAPANFLDVGGGATAEQVTHAFEILNGDSRVQAILVNIFGGIMRCDIIAQGVIAAAKKIGLKKPVVLRLQGTNVNEARAFIEDSGYKIITVDDLDKAAATVVKIADIKRQAEQVSLGVSFELPL